MTKNLHPTRWLRLRDCVARIGAALALALTAATVAHPLEPG